MWWLLLLLLAPPSCSVKVRPNIALAPLRYLRITVTIERDTARDARLELWDADGPITSSAPRVDVRTQEIEWKNIVLGEGEYELMLSAGRCVASARIVVSGE